jgi:hypothetical protein
LRLVSIDLLDPDLIPAPELLVGVVVVDVSQVADNRQLASVTSLVLAKHRVLEVRTRLALFRQNYSAKQ